MIAMDLKAIWEMSAKNKTRLLVLAGYSGAGKTTFLLNALKDDIPIFGEENQSDFQKINIPSRFPEFAISPEEILKQGSWFSTNHLNYLVNSKNISQNIVIHLDLVGLLVRQSYYNGGPEQLLSLFPRSIENLLRTSENVRLNLYLMGLLFQKFQIVTVNTIVAPWKIVAERWHLRGAFPPDREPLFDFDKPREDIFDAIYHSWFRSLSALKPDLTLLTDGKESQKYRITVTYKNQSSFPKSF